MTATYLGSGDPARRRTDYFPVWLNDLADDVTLEASAINGAAQGPEAVRSIILAVKSLYEYQDINFTGDYGDKYFIEDYTTQIQGKPFGVMGVITRNAEGADPAHRRQPAATRHPAAGGPPAGREVRRHPQRPVLRGQHLENRATELPRRPTAPKAPTP